MKLANHGGRGVLLLDELVASIVAMLDEQQRTVLRITPTKIELHE